MEKSKIFIDILGTVGILIVGVLSYKNILPDYNLSKLIQTRNEFETQISGLEFQIKETDYEIKQSDIKPDFTLIHFHDDVSYDDNILVTIYADEQFDSKEPIDKYKNLMMVWGYMNKQIETISNDTGYAAEKVKHNRYGNPSRYDDETHYNVRVNEKVTIKIISNQVEYELDSNDEQFRMNGNYISIAPKDKSKKSDRISNQCLASGCFNLTSKTIIGISGKEEHYCQKHYDEMAKIVGDLILTAK